MDWDTKDTCKRGLEEKGNDTVSGIRACAIGSGRYLVPWFQNIVTPICLRARNKPAQKPPDNSTFRRRVCKVFVCHFADTRFVIASIPLRPFLSFHKTQRGVSSHACILGA